MIICTYLSHKNFMKINVLNVCHNIIIVWRIDEGYYLRLGLSLGGKVLNKAKRIIVKTGMCTFVRK